MTWVKICGITNLEDALIAVDAGADAVGFVVYEKSPRSVSVETAREIVEKLPRELEKVGVFVDADCDQIRRAVLHAALTAVQLHGRPSQQSVWQDRRPAPAKLIAMIAGDRLKDSAGDVLIQQSVHEEIFALLIDSQVNGSSGGTGSTFDWESTRGAIQALSLSVPIIVAGGLNPLNAADAIKTFQPFGLDVSSGVEARPGKKDPEKVRAFVRAVREMDRKVS